VKPGLNYTN